MSGILSKALRGVGAAAASIGETGMKSVIEQRRQEAILRLQADQEVASDARRFEQGKELEGIRNDNETARQKTLLDAQATESKLNREGLIKQAQIAANGRLQVAEERNSLYEKGLIGGAGKQGAPFTFKRGDDGTADLIDNSTGLPVASGPADRVLAKAQEAIRRMSGAPPPPPPPPATETKKTAEASPPPSPTLPAKTVRYAQTGGVISDAPNPSVQLQGIESAMRNLEPAIRSGDGQAQVAYAGLVKQRNALQSGLNGGAR